VEQKKHHDALDFSPEWVQSLPRDLCPAFARARRKKGGPSSKCAGGGGGGGSTYRPSPPANSGFRFGDGRRGLLLRSTRQHKSPMRRVFNAPKTPQRRGDFFAPAASPGGSPGLVYDASHFRAGSGWGTWPPARSSSSSQRTKRIFGLTKRECPCH
jgi:hypothetical protein